MQFDVLKIADLRFPGGTSGAIVHEVRALARAGYRVGLLHKRARVLKQKRPVNPKIQKLLDHGLAELVDPQALASVRARLAVVHNPYVLEDLDDRLPRITCDRAVIVGHQPLFDANGIPYYHVGAVRQNARDLLGLDPPWAPISPLSRTNMASDPDLVLTDEDWTNVLFVDDWRVDRTRPVGDRPVIGRHSRPDWPKWPASRAQMLEIYPADPGFEVKLLGAGDDLHAVMQGAYPDNWTLHPFDAVDVHDFLAAIDFFVYFHHPDWTEGFGRTIAEAAASGLAPILPAHFEGTFGPRGAIYCRPDEVVDVVRDQYADWSGYRLLGDLARRELDKHYGPAPYLSRIDHWIGKPGSAPTVVVPEPAPATTSAAVVPRPVQDTHDIVHLGDFRGCRESAWRVINLARIEHELGYSVGLVHVPTDQVNDLPTIHPEIDQLVIDGVASPAPPDLKRLTARIAFVHQPGFLFDRLATGRDLPLPGFAFERCVVIHDRHLTGAQIRAKHAQLRALFGPIPITWAAADERRREEIESAEAPSERETFTPAIACAPWRNPRPWRSRPVIGRVSLGDATQWPPMPHPSLPADASCIARVLGLPTARHAPGTERLERFALKEISTFKFTRNLDAFVYYPGERPSELPVHAALTALCHGVPTYIDGRFKEAFGRGPRYLDATQALDEIRTLYADPDRYARQAADGARQARQRCGPQTHGQRLRRWIGAARSAPQVVGSARARVLFISSNGVGLGHLTRLLAIARRMPSTVEPVFLTMSQALEIVRQAGYPVEYMPFHVYANCDPLAWSGWFAEQFDQVLDFHRPRAVVFDGGQPYQGLLDAMAERRTAELIWIRRGMWREGQDNQTALERQRLFDLVIEPGEIAAAADRGSTAGVDGRAIAVPVAPIRLLDEDELLPRDQACARLGLDPDRPSCLVQLGSGSNRDIVAMIDTVLEHVSKIDGMQPVLAEWLISRHELDFWPGVPRLRGFPLSLYFNAFDFTLSAAGYNSFNEIISFGLPAIFMANQHATMDDQHGRATFAQSHDAAFALPDDRPDAVPLLLESILDPARRQLMRANCARISLDNGARTAADAIAAVL